MDVEQEDRHQVFKNDPFQFRKLIYHHVTVTTKYQKSKLHAGWVHTVDPVSESIVLVNFSTKDGPLRMSEIQIIPGYNVEDVTVNDDKCPQDIICALDSLFKNESVAFTTKELEERREALCVWLADNRVPYTVSEDMSIEVLRTAIIRPPYTTESIHCTNEVVLDKVMKLVSEAPKLSQDP